MANNGSVRLLQLPATALAAILPQLSRPEQGALRQTCRATRQLVDGSTTKLRLLPRAGFVGPQLQARFPAVTELDLSKSEAAQPQMLQLLLQALAGRAWPTVVTLRLPMDLRVAEASSVVSACPHTTTLIMYGEKRNQKQLAAVIKGARRCLPQLVSVDIYSSWCHPAGDAPLEALANTCRGLQSLKCLIECGARGVAALCALTALTYLDLHDWDTKMQRKLPGWLGGLSSLSRLASLRVMHYGDQGGLATALPYLAALTRLHVPCLDAGTVVGPKLEEAFVGLVNTATLQMLATNCQKLRKLGCQSWDVESSAAGVPPLAGVTAFELVRIGHSYQGHSIVPVAHALPNCGIWGVTLS